MFFMKKVVNIFIILSLISTMFVYAEETEYKQNLDIISNCGIVEAHYFDSPKIVSRYECLTAIMKAIGVIEDGSGARILLVGDAGWTNTDKIYYDGDGGCLLDKNGNTVYLTDWHPLMVNDDGKGTIYDYWKYTDEATCFAGLTGINIAFAYGIAKGEIYNGRRYFNFGRAVSLSETILFMIRCLGDIELNDSAVALQKALEYGLITKEDSFYGNEDVKLTPEEFCKILTRFLNQKRYYYFDDNVDYGQSMLKDTTGSMTYLEYLSTREVECE